MPSLIIISWITAVIYAGAVTVLAVYGVHSLWLLGLFLRHRRAAGAQADAEEATPLPAAIDLPTVLVQLPVFNERDVVVRLVECAGRLDWPKDRLVIQLLDDSTDDSVLIGRQAIAALCAQGFTAHSLHRTDRTGFKAGALEAGLHACTAPFIAIFDADFLPHPDFLRKAIKPLLADPGLALVQGRWGHLNRDDNLLTRAQALGIDGHFAIEQGARAWSGLAMNFNGTCGLWRRQAIVAGGGWEHDTLTEDMDLSYRVQLAGWRCTYRLGLAVPGEIPASLAAWRQQQFRWAKGSIQTACKLLPRIWRSHWNLHARVAATLHMTHYLVHPLILLSLLCAPPAMLLATNLPAWILTLGLFGFAVGAGAPPLLYAVSQWVLEGPKGWRRLAILPALAAVGTGIAVSNARAVWEALIGRQSEFVRTPKQGFAKQGSYKAGAATGIPELLCVCWAALGLLAGFKGQHTWIAPLLLIYISGFGWVAVRSLYERLRAVAHHHAANGSPLPLLIPLGLALVAGFALLVRGGGGWRLAPGWSAAIACGLGALWLAAVAVVRLRPGGPRAFAWIVAVAIALRVIAVGWMPPAVETHRALFEGRQVASGQNAYAVAPDAEAGRALLGRGVPDSTFFAIADRSQPATTAPLMLWFNGMLSEFAATPRTFKVAAAVLELAALALVLALLARWHLPFGLILVAAWHPLLPLFGAGEGHLDILVGALLAAGLLAAAAGRHLGATAAASLAMLARPLAVVGLLPHLLAGGSGESWHQRSRRWLAPVLLTLIAFVVLRDDLAGMIDRAIAERPLHGALEPWLRFVVETWLGSGFVRPLVPGLLAVAFTAGAWWLHQDVARRNLDRNHPAQHAHLLALGMICLPSLSPWLLVPLALLLPFTPSWGLLLWTALAPLYWLHDHRAVAGGERLLVAAVAHVPALLLVAWEVAGRPTPWRNLDVERDEVATA